MNKAACAVLVKGQKRRASNDGEESRFSPFFRSFLSCADDDEESVLYRERCNVDHGSHVLVEKKGRYNKIVSEGFSFAKKKKNEEGEKQGKRKKKRGYSRFVHARPTPLSFSLIAGVIVVVIVFAVVVDIVRVLPARLLLLWRQ